MKKCVIIILLFISCGTTYSQNRFAETDGVYLGAGFHVGFASDVIDGYKTPYKPRSLGIYFPVGYRVNDWQFELSAQYSGALISSFIVGRYIHISETCNFQIMGGLADNLIVLKEPLQVIHQFSYNFTGRLQLGDFYFQATQIQDNTYLGIGFIGLANLTDY